MSQPLHTQSEILSFELNNSLMDRFIKLYLNNSDKSILRWITGGLTDKLLSDRSEWFGKPSIYINWQLDSSGDISIEDEIREAIYLVFSVLGKSTEKSHAPKRYEGVPMIFNNIVRLSVAQSHNITTYSRYKTFINSSDAALQYLLYKLGYLEIVKYRNKDTLQLKGEPRKYNQDGNLKDVTFGDIQYFITRRIEQLGNYGALTKVVDQLREQRNNESHNAFFTNPEKYWDRLVYLIYDYVAIAFFLTRYFKSVENGTIQAVKNEDMKAVSDAVEKIDSLVGEAEKINVRFQFLHDETQKQKLSVEDVATPKNKFYTAQPNPKTITENGIKYCYYDKPLDRNTVYTLQSIIVNNGVDTTCGTKLELNAGLLFDGAVVTLKMPTESIEYPTIESIIAKSTGLLEDTENRAVIEKLLADSIDDDTLRSKLRVILMLDKGDKESIFNEFIRQGGAADNISSDDFKKFIEDESDTILKTIDKHFESLNDSISNSLNTNREELKDFISDAIAGIDLNEILTSNAKLKEELNEINKWLLTQTEVEKQNADEARKMYDSLKNKIEKQSNQNLEELSRIFKSQTSLAANILSGVGTIIDGLDKEKRSRKIRNVIFASIGVLVLLFLTGCYRLRTSSDDFVVHSKYMSEWAHNTFGNKDVAYERAKYLESVKSYPDAAKWYMRARERYADILTENPTDTTRALRMTQMLMRGKGGIIDKKKAEDYARLAKRFDIEAYLAAANGNPHKAMDIVNNFQEDTTSYLLLAEALGTLCYPHSASDHNQIRRYWNIVDSLASTTNPATEEALLTAVSLSRYGVANNTYILAPSLHGAAAYATDADIHFNSLTAQLFLASLYESMGLTTDAERYNKKAESNGRKGDGEITFSHNRINELYDDPQALMARAHQNAAKGYTDYRMTAYYYHLADSINNITNQYDLSAVSYMDWANFVVNAGDLNSTEQLLPLINKKYPDSIRMAIADYIMGIKLAKTGNEELNDSISHYLLSAASKGLEDAQVSVGISWDLQNKPDGMKTLEQLAYRDSDKIHYWAARYILSKRLHNNELDHYLLDKLVNDEFSLTIRLSHRAFVNNLLNFDKETLVSLKHQINIVLSQQSDLTQYAYLFGKLAEIEYILGDKDATDFYISAANNLSPKSAYTSIFGISEIARRNGQLETAFIFAGRFAKVFFLENGKALDESERYSVIQHFKDLYPEILELVKADKKYDFAKELIFLQSKEVNPQEYYSTVKNLHVELPNYERFTFPVTMKYFE